MGSVTEDDYLNTFTFHGGEFGNWLNDNDRQYSLDYGYDAFYGIISNKLRGVLPLHREFYENFL